MVFSGITFLFYFLPAVLLLYAVVPKQARNTVLLLASVVFYVWGAGYLVLTLLFSVIVDYALGFVAQRGADEQNPRTIRWAITASVVLNVGLLAWFKYAGWLIDIAADAGVYSGSVPEIVLPIGISFFTFQSMSYTIDVARGRCDHLSNPLDFALYVTLFPQLIAGPIVRYHEIEPQIRDRWFSVDQVGDGAVRFSHGLAKKGPRRRHRRSACRPVVHHCGDRPKRTHVGRRLDWSCCVHPADLLRFQRLLRHGHRLGQDVRLHLSGELPATVFRRLDHRLLAALAHHALELVPRLRVRAPGRKPRGGRVDVPEPHGRLPAHRRVAWSELDIRGLGAFHGLWLLIERRTGLRSLDEARRSVVAVRRATTLLIVVFGWVLFRSDDLDAAGNYYAAMFAFDELGAGVLDGLITTRVTLTLLLACTVVLLSREFVAGPTLTRSENPPVPARALIMLVAFPAALLLVAAGAFSPFLYFQF